MQTMSRRLVAEAVDRGSILFIDEADTFSPAPESAPGLGSEPSQRVPHPDGEP